MVATPMHILAMIPAEPKPATVRTGPVKATPIAAPRAIDSLPMTFPMSVEVCIAEDFARRGDIATVSGGGHNMTSWRVRIGK